MRHMGGGVVKRRPNRWCLRLWFWAATTLLLFLKCCCCNNCHVVVVVAVVVRIVVVAPAPAAVLIFDPCHCGFDNTMGHLPTTLGAPGLDPKAPQAV